MRLVKHVNKTEAATDEGGARRMGLQLEYKVVARPQCSASNNFPVPGSGPHRPAYYWQFDGVHS